MPKGVWIWPSDARGQRRMSGVIAASPHLMAAMSALSKSKEGLSNPELAEALGDGSEWTTLWVVRQLTSLGFMEFKVDFFGNPARYQMTEQGRAAYSAMTGQPQAKAPAQTPPPPAPQPAAPKAAQP